jgi:hypothetical protein
LIPPKPNRRKFMALLGFGAASAPLAAKAASETETMRLVDVVVGSGGVADEFSAPSPQSGAVWRESFASAADFIKLFGLPAHVEASLRRDSQSVYRLDLDIAAKRSWSLSVKFQEQRKRNYDQRIAQMIAAGGEVRAQNLFKQTTGFDWPW